MKTIFLSLALFFSSLGFADATCLQLSTEEFVQELIHINQEHMQMTIEEVHADYQQGIAFIAANFKKDSELYQRAQTFLSDTADMNLDDMNVVETLRIQIIPILGPQDIYRGQQEILMRKCREILLAAMILT
jgi:hypothetical protein